MSGEWDDICQPCVDEVLQWCGYLSPEKESPSARVYGTSEDQTKESPYLRPSVSNPPIRPGRNPPTPRRTTGEMAGSSYDD